MRADATGRITQRSEATAASYRRRARELSIAAGAPVDDIPTVVAWFGRQEGRWAPSTVRQYKAALKQSIEDAIGRIGAAQSEALMRQLDKSPQPRSGGTKLTSARKRKSMPIEEADRLVSYLLSSTKSDDRLIGQMLKHGFRICVRPSEFRQALITGGVLKVKNAKSTNGRSFGSHRHLELDGYGVKATVDLEDLLAKLRLRCKSFASFSRMLSCLSSRLARTCAKLNIRRVSFYTIRHVGLARCKTFMTPIQVAAVAGHRTTRTASSHYAKARSGWKRGLRGSVRASTDDLKLIVVSPKQSRSTNLDYLSSRWLSSRI